MKQILFPKTNCSWLKPDGFFEIGNKKWSHTDYIRNNAIHIECMPKPVAGDTDRKALTQFMLETGWIQTSYYPTINKAIFFKVQPFTKQQRNAIKDLEIFGYDCKIEDETTLEDNGDSI